MLINLQSIPIWSGIRHFAPNRFAITSSSYEPVHHMCDNLLYDGDTCGRARALIVMRSAPPWLGPVSLTGLGEVSITTSVHALPSYGEQSMANWRMANRLWQTGIWQNDIISLQSILWHAILWLSSLARTSYAKATY